MLAGTLLTVSCNNGASSTSISGRSDELQLKIAFHPAFNERSEISLVSKDSTKNIEILLTNRETAVIRPDTFYWKQVELTSQQYKSTGYNPDKIVPAKIRDPL